MNTYAGTQQSVFDPNIGFPGDQYGLSKSWLPTQGFLAASDLLIGTFCWGINGTKQVTQAKGVNTQLAGFVVRSQASVIPYANTASGFSYGVSQGYQCAVLSSGSLIANITESYNIGGLINVRDTIFVNTTTGTLAVGVTNQAGYYETDFIVVINQQYNTNGFNQVVISNVEQFLGS
jgi:hypothetical protein